MISALKAKWSGFSALLGLSLVLAGCGHPMEQPKEGAGPAGPTIAREAFHGTWSEGEVLLLGVGDSVTAGFGASKGKSYFERLVKNPPDEVAEMKDINLSAVVPNLRTKNIAISGSDSLQHWAREVKNLSEFPTNAFGIVVMTTGGNDLIHNYGQTAPKEGAMYGASFEQAKPWIEKFRMRLNQMVEVIGAKFPGGCEIYLANIYDPTDGKGDLEKAGLPRWKDGLQILNAYNEIIADCARTHKEVFLVDIHEGFLGHGIHNKSEGGYWYYTNLEDPNEQGYDALRRLFLKTISEQSKLRPAETIQETKAAFNSSRSVIE